MALAGDLSEFSLTDLIQLLQLSKKTGGVEIDGRRGTQKLTGWIFFRDGKIVDAKLPGLEPLEAVYTFFTVTSGPFRFHEGVTSPQTTITASNESIIMEGVHRQETWSQQQTTTPTLAMVPRLVPNPASGTVEISLNAEEWRILTMINGKHTVGQITQRSGLGEARTCEIIAKLMQSGLIERREAAAGESLAPEFEQIAAGYLGAGANVLLQEAYRIAGVIDPSRASAAEMLAAADAFEAEARRLIGADRASQAAAQLRERARELLV